MVRTRCTEPFPLFSILFRSICSHRLNFLFLFITWPIGIVFIIANIIAKIVVSIAWICYSPTRNSRRISANSCNTNNFQIPELEFLTTIRYLFIICHLIILPMHFSKCGAKRDDATGRSQFGQTQSIVFFVFVEPNTSMSGISTMLNLHKTKSNISKPN